jgi:2-dehydro-3-deoxy-D-arabinonate dehydratase
MPVHILRYSLPGSSRAHVGILDEGRLAELDGVVSLGSLWALPVEALQAKVASARGTGPDPADVTVLAPVDGRTEVWACGVTYEISREARREESEHAADIYEQVYGAQRPEIFFKSASWRVSGSGQPIAVRADSAVSVPEPEVALVVSGAARSSGPGRQARRSCAGATTS